jgi:hypothetical protein
LHPAAILTVLAGEQHKLSVLGDPVAQKLRGLAISTSNLAVQSSAGPRASWANTWKESGLTIRLKAWLDLDERSGPMLGRILITCIKEADRHSSVEHSTNIGAGVGN